MSHYDSTIFVCGIQNLRLRADIKGGFSAFSPLFHPRPEHGRGRRDDRKIDEDLSRCRSPFNDAARENDSTSSSPSGQK